VRGGGIPDSEPEKVISRAFCPIVEERDSAREVRIRAEKSGKRREWGLIFSETLLCFREYYIRIHLDNTIKHNSERMTVCRLKQLFSV
jgi:hypothetical protein